MGLEARTGSGPPFGVRAHVAEFVHDVFNLVCISILDVLSLLNWRFEASAWSTFRITDGPETWSSRWAGYYQDELMTAVFLYMVIDIVFVYLLPQSVKAPRAILVHHVACFAAMAIPWQYAATHGYTLGIFMTADFNTLFLVLRKMLMRTRTDQAPWLPWARHAVSAGFYFTWVSVRLVLYPVWLFAVSWPEWTSAWERTGSPLNIFAVMPLTNGFAVALNAKWTYDLLSKCLRRRRRNQAAGDNISKTDDDSLIDPLMRR
mmetsp:Transcript_27998/g.63371  ORF Transcript_27998/g.63371 Transcript_27998/m.63371 type:complete len:261 (-) Transcript_27998:153-935(-)